MKPLILSLVIIGATTALAVGQIGVTHYSLDAKVAQADLIVVAKVSKAIKGKQLEQELWLDLTLEVKETLKGKVPDPLTIAQLVSKVDQRWEQFIESGQEQLWFLMDSRRSLPGEDPKSAAVRARHAFKPIDFWHRIRLGPEVADETSFSRPPPPLFTMHFEVLTKPEEILAATRRIVSGEPAKRGGWYAFSIPRLLAARVGGPGDANSFVVPDDSRLEALARRLIESPEAVLLEVEGDPEWRQFAADRLREEGAKALRNFKKDEHTALLKSLLDHPARVGQHGTEETHYFVRQAAFGVLREWKVAVEQPLLVEGRDARPPKNDDDLRSWLENMVWHHKFGHWEITSALGLEGEDEIESALARFNINWRTKPKRARDAPLLVLPYPGGRHPRIGFCEGAIMPQRETKVSIFTPWDEDSYVVADIPEAIWSNLGLTYLAHTHVPTIWTKQNIELEKLEWNRRADGTLDMQRRLPNGIEFGTRVIPGQDAVRMEMWLKNGTQEKLTGLRVQNCLMLKGARGFQAQTNDNKILSNPYVAVHNDEKNRWIITAWDPCHRPWANPPCPCLHSDPRFPDCAPGETQRLHGWLSFYEGEDLEAELQRIENTGWRK